MELKLDRRRRGKMGWQRERERVQRVPYGGCLDSVRKSKRQRHSGNNTDRARELGAEVRDWSV